MTIPSDGRADDIPLNSLNDILLTPREIDVLGCLLSGKSNKSIASFLSISPRTVDAHLRALMMKLGCHSREDLIHFVERSAQYGRFKKHYEQLLIQEIFHKTLKNISQLLIHKKFTCLMREAHKSIPIHQFTDHLEMAGLLILPISKSKASLDHPKEERKYQIVLSNDDSQGDETTEDESDDYVLIDINLKRYQTYNDALFDCISRLFPELSSNLEQIFASFKKQVKTLEGSEVPFTQQHPIHLPNPFWLPSTSFSYIITMGGGVASLGALIFSLWTYYQSNAKEYKQGYSSISSLRSELPLPQEQSHLERPDLLKQIDDNYKTQHADIKIVALVGPGGAGKTTLARHYARSQQNSVVWELNAETQESLLTSLFDLAYGLAQTPDLKRDLEVIKNTQDSPEREKYLLVFVKKELKKRPSWFLIYDNVDNLSDIKAFFPQDSQVWGEGRVILSTRDQTIENTTYINPSYIIPVNEFTETDALILLSKILYGKKPAQLTADIRTNLSLFLKQIPLFPLDVFIAASYIKHTRISCDQYLKRIQQYTKEFDKTQEALLKNVNHYTKTRYGIISVSLEKMIQVSPDFKELLLLVCLLDSQNIPKSFLESYKEMSVIEQFLYNLRRNALITHEFSTRQEKTSHTFSLHRSTQEMGLIFLKNLLSDKEKFEAINRMVDGIKSFKELSEDIKSFVSFSKAIDCPERLLLLPHLDVLSQRLQELKLPKELYNKTQVYLCFLRSIIHYCCTSNMLLSQKYCSRFFEQIARIDGDHQSIPPNMQAIVALVLGVVCIDLGSPDEGLIYLEKGLLLIEKISGAEIFKSEALRLIGIAYTRKNEFEKSTYFYEMALEELSKVEGPLKKEAEAETYLQLASSHSNYHLHKKPNFKAEQYILKSLEISGARHLLCETKEQNPALLTFTVARQKERLGEVYNRMGFYQEAITRALRDADYVMEQGGLSSHLFLKAEIDLNIGEALLREGNLEEAEQRLTNSLKTLKKILGPTSDCSWQARVYRAEVRFRLGKLDMAYEDCASVLDLEQKNPHPYAALLHSIAFYHAAIIKYRQNDFEKAAKHFADFFKKIKVFCISFLDKEVYQDLESKMVFELSVCNIVQDLKLCCQRSASIFSAIYGDSHPFVKSFILKNAIA